MVDTGASSSFISTEVQHKLQGEVVLNGKREYRAYNRTRVDVIGRTAVSLQIEDDNSNKTMMMAIVVNPIYQVVLGRDIMKGWQLSRPIIEEVANQVECTPARLWTISAIEESPQVDDSVESSLTMPEIEVNSNVDARISKLPLETQNVIAKHMSVFRKELDAVGCKASELMHINLKPGSVPVKKMPYKRNPRELGYIDIMSDKLLERGIIEPSRSEWGAAIVLIKKRGEDGLPIRSENIEEEYRMCIDYRGVNSCTYTEIMPLPRQEEVRDKMKLCKFFTKIDLKKGYWQLWIDKPSRHLTAFVTHRGQFQFTRVSMGLRTACQYFQRTLKKVLEGLESFVDNHVDDIVIFSKTKEEGLRNLDTVLQRLEDANLIGAIDKCDFLQPSVVWCGYDYVEGGIRPTTNKVAAIQRIPYPNDASEVRSFLGVCNFYRKFIPNFAAKAANLVALTCKDAEWEWNESLAVDWDDLKQALSIRPVLVNADYEKPFVVRTDASLRGIGATLEQPDAEGRLHPVSYMSKSLNKAQRNYAIVELECLALVHAVEEWRQYLSYRPFAAFTDHKPLTWIIKNKDTPNRRIQRWMMTLSEFEFTLEYVKGENNTVPDALSRLQYMSGEITAIEEPDNDVNSVLKSRELWDMVRMSVEEREALKENWSKKEHNRSERTRFRRLCKLADNLHINELELYHKGRRVIMEIQEREKIIKAYHAVGHFGIEATMLRILRDYWWPEMHTHVHLQLCNCQQCVDYADRSLGTRLLPTANHMEPTDAPGSRVHVDYTGPFPKTSKGNTGIFFFTDVYTGFVVEHVTTTKTAKEAAKGYLKWISLFGPADHLLSDQGKEFLNKMLESLCNEVDTTRLLTSGYHPTTNGAAEKTNHILITALRKICQGNIKDWDELLTFVMFADRTRPRLQHGNLSPMYLMTGRDAPSFFTRHTDKEPEHHDLLLKLDRINHLIEIVHPALAKKVREQYKRLIRRDRDVTRVNDSGLAIGSHVVLMKPPTIAVGKMDRRTTQGVYKVLERTSKGNYVLETLTGKPLITPAHPSRIRPIGEQEAARRLTETYDRSSPDSNEDEDDDVFEVERILDHRRRMGRDEYKIKWVGYEDEHTWVREDLIDAPDRIREYWENMEQVDTDIEHRNTPGRRVTAEGARLEQM